MYSDTTKVYTALGEKSLYIVTGKIKNPFGDPFNQIKFS